VAHSEFASPRATIAVLKEHGLYTRKSLGQHFLIDDNVVGRIVALAGLDGRERVVEIGPGIGTLTTALCRAAGSVVAVERDERLLGVLGELAGRYGNLTVVHDDAVTVSAAQMVGDGGLPVALVANLPYAVAATVVLRFFEEFPFIERATVMVQAEVADRMAATPGTKAYGSYSVKLALRARPDGRFAVARGCFLPPPRVDSAVLRLVRVSHGAAPETIVRAAAAADAAFAQRRKTLRNSLAGALGAPVTLIEATLAAAGINGGRRAETFGPETFLELGSALHTQSLLP
jgi:16S rRNA (adenine1518-N6/adenine1519-N6)-dimethyltransferase